MKKLTLIMAMAFFVPAPALLAAAADDEVAVKQVLDTLAARAGALDARGMAELFSEDAVMKYFYGARNEPKTAQGRASIYTVFSLANILSYKVDNIKVTKVEGDLAGGTGRTNVQSTGFGVKGRRITDVTWQLKRIGGTWQISLYEFELAPWVRD